MSELAVAASSVSRWMKFSLDQQRCGLAGQRLNWRKTATDWLLLEHCAMAWSGTATRAIPDLNNITPRSVIPRGRAVAVAFNTGQCRIFGLILISAYPQRGCSCSSGRLA
ncbi:MAG: hypothetical protein H6664_04360 [Ardenticatenaceae bacterium]|nr:hypothetical protein [Ardenticatenaceae bacterium]